MSDGRDGAASSPFINSFLLKRQFIPFGRDLDFIPRLELTFEQAHRKRIENVFLNGAVERARGDAAESIFAPLVFVAGRRVVKARPS
jgi:hypothetical protein